MSGWQGQGTGYSPPPSQYTGNYGNYGAGAYQGYNAYAPPGNNYTSTDYYLQGTPQQQNPPQYASGQQTYSTHTSGNQISYTTSASGNQTYPTPPYPAQQAAAAPQAYAQPKTSAAGATAYLPPTSYGYTQPPAFSSYLPASALIPTSSYAPPSPQATQGSASSYYPASPANPTPTSPPPHHPSASQSADSIARLQRLTVSSPHPSSSNAHTSSGLPMTQSCGDTPIPSAPVPGGRTEKGADQRSLSATLPTGDGTLERLKALRNPKREATAPWGGLWGDRRLSDGQQPKPSDPPATPANDDRYAVKPGCSLGEVRRGPNTAAAPVAPVDKLVHYCFCGSQAEVMDAKFIPEINRMGVRGVTPLYVATRQGFAAIVAYLLDKGAEPNARMQEHGSTALHAAAYYNRTPCAVLLLLRGADPLIKNKYGKTALEESILQNHDEMKELLMECTSKGINWLRSSTFSATVSSLMPVTMSKPSKTAPWSTATYVYGAGAAPGNGGDGKEQAAEPSDDVLTYGSESAISENGDTSSNASLTASMASSDDEFKFRELKFKELNISGAPIGQGAFGVVHRGRWRGALVAVKRLLVSNLDQKLIKEFKREASLVHKLSHHPNVINFIGACTEAPNFALVTEWCPNGSMYDLLVKKKRPLTMLQLVRMMLGAAAGILHLHIEGVIHRDIAARNVLVGDSLTAFVSDFGLSRQIVEESLVGHTESNIGPVKYMAPEAIAQKNYSVKSDSFSFGAFIWECVTRQEPYDGENLYTVARGVVDGTKRLPIPADAPKPLADLMRDCFEQNPDKRPDFRQIVQRLSDFEEELMEKEGDQ